MKTLTIRQAVEQADALLRQPEHGPLSAVMIAASALGDDEKNFLRVKNAFVRRHPKFAKVFKPLACNLGQLHFPQIGVYHD